MQHGLMYQGSYEENYPALRSGSNTYRATDGSERPIPAWPAGVDGVRVGYMEKAGKKFFAVRVQYGSDDIILKTPVLMDQSRHLGSKRFAPEPTTISDKQAETLLDDIIGQNSEQKKELALLINRVNKSRRDGRDAKETAEERKKR